MKNVDFECELHILYIKFVISPNIVGILYTIFSKHPVGFSLREKN